jgi:hypothetical protein
MQDPELTSSPFDVQQGILFKYGRLFQDRDRQLAEFEREIGTKLPLDFLELIGQYCSGSFDGHYQVFADDGVEVNWDYLLPMKLVDGHDVPQHDVLRILGEKSAIFYDDRDLALLPFGQAGVIGNRELRPSYLAFDLRNEGSVVCIVGEPLRPHLPTGNPDRSQHAFFQLLELSYQVKVPASGGRRIRIAKSFREMMLQSKFIFYG